jgi:hypothetical protein
VDKGEGESGSDGEGLKAKNVRIHRGREGISERLLAVTNTN